MFATVNKLTNPPVPVASEYLSTRACNGFASFFTAKILKIRQRQAAKTNYNAMKQFHPIIDKNLQEIIQHLNYSSCCLDILLAGFLKKVSDCMIPDLLQIDNMSLLSGVFPQAMKTAVIKPLLKTENLDTFVMKNYRPISNLPILSFDVFQSGFKPHHSTGTALIKVLNDINLNTGRGKISVSVLLDISAATIIYYWAD